MAETSTLSFRVDADIIDRVDDAAGRAGTSRSALAREAFLQGLQVLAEGEHDDAEIRVPEHLGHDAKIRDLIARNKRNRRLGKFRSEFNAQVKKSFTGTNCETPQEFRQSVSGYLEESEDLGEIPGDVARQIHEEHGVAFDTWAEWTSWMVEEYYPAHYHAQQFDGQHTSDPLGSLSGISNAHEWMQRAEHIADAAKPGNTGPEPRVLAQHAYDDGIVPENVQDVAEAQGDDLLDGIVQAAEQTAQGSALTDSDRSELES